MKQDIFKAGRGRVFTLLLLPLLSPVPAFAQFFRLGPFNFEGDVGFDIVYESNVDGERQTREAQQKGKDPEDLYYVLSLQLRSSEELPGRTRGNIEVGMQFEKHPDRPDLDQTTAPLGNIDLTIDRQIGPYNFSAGIGYERQTEVEGEYVPGGGNRATRDPNEVFHYDLGFGYKRGAFDFTVMHGFERERHLTREFTDGDKDTYHTDIGASLRLLERLSLVARLENEDELIIQTDEERVQYTYLLGLEFAVMKKPAINYTFGYESEDNDTYEPTKAWDPVHMLSISDSRKLTPTLDLTLDASYEYDPEPAFDENTFNYGASLKHELDRWTTHSLTATREPVDTFGSTVESDQTTFTYELRRQDLFIRGLAAGFSVMYDRTIPVDGPTEKVYTYELMLEHIRQLTRRLGRTISYTYSAEDSNLEELLLEEHVLTLGFEYTL